MATYDNFVEQSRACDPRRFSTRSSGARKDLLHRFSSTPCASDLKLMGRTIRLESNDDAFLRLAFQFFQSHQHGATNEPEFLWRLVCEPDPQAQSTAVPLSAFSTTGGLRYANVGQRGFFALDLDSREAVGFLSEVFFETHARLRHRPPLDILFCMTAASLGLVALSAGCVGANGRGVIVFGPPNSGKTTSCFLAAQSGLEFHADQVVFLDARHRCAWGDPFPAVFRPETLDFLPELRSKVHQSTYANSSFYYFDKSSVQPQQAHPITPVCSIFLDRSAKCDTRMRDVPRDETISRIRESVLFEEDRRFDEQLAATIEAVAEKPAYELHYDTDPKIAADFVEKMLR